MRENLWLSLILGEQFAYKWRKHTLICGFLIKEGELPVWIDGNNLFSLAVYASRLSLLLNCSYSLCNLCLLLGRSFSPKKFFFGIPYIWLFDENIKKELVSNEFVRLMATIYFLGSSPTKYRRRVRA